MTLRIFVLFSAVLLVSCSKTPQETHEAINSKSLTPHGLVEEVLTKEGQDALSPDSVLHILKIGNQRFVNNDLTARNHSEQVRNSAMSQYPKAIILSCVDSRVPVEDVFDRGIGDIFVARVAGNFVNEDILGSMEFACKVSGSKVILVMGHENCGAIKAAIDDVHLGNITSMLTNIKPAVNDTSFHGERSTKNPEFVHSVCIGNVRHTIEQIRLKSPILKEMEDTGKIKIAGAVYDLGNGEVEWL
ncbi:MAG: carbonic anhydrase [Flavobacteriales bacterium]|nr:carbonic anhydrase [Bacteroidota bacterium]MCB9240045.1 carbonic anhydrase [Flavobacteriales bacterium]